MQTTTYRRLCLLHQRHGPREFGKICQKLLALAFRAGGCDHVVERGVQGVDIDAGWGAAKYTAEIKTTKKSAIHLASKDIAGLAARRADGYHPLLGLLRLAPLADWLLVDATSLTVGTVPIDSLRWLRCRELENRLRPLFDTVLDLHFEPTLREAQACLDRALRTAGVVVAADAWH
jgi:Holliday junction resolvase